MPRSVDDDVHKARTVSPVVSGLPRTLDARSARPASRGSCAAGLGCATVLHRSRYLTVRPTTVPHSPGTSLQALEYTHWRLVKYTVLQRQERNRPQVTPIKTPTFPELRPRSITEIMDVGLAVYRDNLRHLLIVSALCQIPLGVLNLTAAATFFNGVLPSLTGSLEGDSLDWGIVVAAVVGSLGVGLLSAVVLSFGLTAMLWSLDRRMHGEQPGVAAAYRGALPRVPSFLLTRILFGLALVGVFLPAAAAGALGGRLVGSNSGGGVIGGLLIAAAVLFTFLGMLATVFLWIRWRFYAQTSVIERQSPVQALRRAREVTADRWGLTFLFVVFLWLLTAALSIAPSSVAQVPLLIFYGGNADTEFAPQAITQAVGTLTSILILPVEVVSLTMLYYDFRVRSEGLDLRRRIEQLNVPTETVLG